MKTLRTDLLLLLTALIWGFAFVAQRVGMEYVGPFTFNAVRFALGGLTLLPVALFLRRKGWGQSGPTRALWWAGPLVGLVLFGGASLQQAGIVSTTAGNAGFITGLYVILVPLTGLLWGQRAGAGAWVGALLAVVGLYLLSVTSAFAIQRGDLLVLLGALFWTAHVQLIGWLTQRVDALLLSVVQFLVCAVLSLTTALFTESITAQGLVSAVPTILYGGLLSVGVAYTLQVVAQRTAKPPHAAILLSLESAFAALGGWLLLSEQLTPRALLGCGLMLAGMLLSQLLPKKADHAESVPLSG